MQAVTNSSSNGMAAASSATTNRLAGSPRLLPRAAAAAAARQRTGGRQVLPAACQASLTEREMEIKLAIAQSTDRLDLSECQLEQLPSAVFDLTALRELSLAGNQLDHLPAAISSLSCLTRLVLAGNQLQQLPQELLELSALEGLWVHGNQLREVPEGLGRLTRLKQLSLAGNALSRVPDSLTQLVGLADLNLAGNQLQALPQGIGALTGLVKLSLHGNSLPELPQQGWEQLTRLDELCVQGNRLSALPDSLARLGALTELSIADNQITRLPEDLSGWSSLRKAHFYGNALTELPLGPRGLPALLTPRQAANGTSSSSGGRDGRDGGGNGAAGVGGGGPGLASLWLEGNPLSAACVSQLLQLLQEAHAAAGGTAGSSSSSNGGSKVSKRQQQPRIGLDDRQLSGQAVLQQWAQLHQQGYTNVRRGIVKGEGDGYFKLQLGPTSPLHAANSGDASSSSSSKEGRVLVVAFGSAPGLPNWGGVLAKVAAAAESPEQMCFDVLYVVDPHRSWYCGGDPALMEQRYTQRLRQYTQQYRHVVMMGDSMGATACLLFSPLATAVLSFCPQVDLSTSSIRPGQPRAWQAALQEALMQAVEASTARITVFTGTWQHDVDQANLLARHANVTIKAHSVDSHRLALALAAGNRLAPILREAILGELGISSGNVRLTNLL